MAPQPNSVGAPSLRYYPSRGAVQLAQLTHLYCFFYPLYPKSAGLISILPHQFLYKMPPKADPQMRQDLCIHRMLRMFPSAPVLDGRYLLGGGCLWLLSTLLLGNPSSRSWLLKAKYVPIGLFRLNAVHGEPSRYRRLAEDPQSRR